MISGLLDALETLVFKARPLLIAFFVLATLVMAYGLSNMHVDAGYLKHLPLQHEYMQTFVKYQDEFGGANRILVALKARNGNIFTKSFFDALRKATDEVFFLPGVDRSQVRSLFTPNVRFTEVVEDGIAGGNVVPADFQPTPEGLAEVRKNILKSGIIGRLVANDFSAAIISAELLEIDPNTGEQLDFIAVGRQLEKQLRGQFENEQTSVHIIGYAKVVADIADGAKRVILFFIVAFLVSGFLVYVFTRSHRITILVLICALVAVVWQLGLLTYLGFGIDPMGILVPFLIFAISVSHGVQMITANRAEVFEGADSLSAARSSFRRLLVPGAVALLSDTIGFITIMLISIEVIQQMAITASLGVATIILTNLLLLPVLLSYIGYPADYRQRLHHRVEKMDRIWLRVAKIAKPWPAASLILVALALLVFGAMRGSQIEIGDLHPGVPELRSDSRYNIDSQVITKHFSIGVDVLNVIVETVPNGCIDYGVMETIDRFAWQMQNTKGVQSAIALPGVAKVINAGWNEGALKWRVLPRNQQVLVEAVQYIPTSSGLLNADCSVMPVMVFTTDHKAETIAHVVDKVKQFQKDHGSERIRFRLGTGNIGVMAATNEEVASAQFPILIYVFVAIIVLCLLTFRSVKATLAITLPLGLVSLLAYALMTQLKIGLKVSTLPVVALGVGIGVDYGIYIYSRFQRHLDQGMTIFQAYHETLKVTGTGVLITGTTLAVGTATWIFSPLQFQADMGLLLTFMFVLNMLGAILILPALASWLLRISRRY
ncbi:MAG: MMPL family transporter [Deltaproteobacteria bacterium]|jgi:predicted RND superfamily exporter protein|nr:MMPL family transporter [Deltaproteobacteria bacterium]